MRTLVIGIGNPILTDDGVGVHVARRLQKELNNYKDIQERFTTGLEILEMVKDYDRVIIVDAIKTKNGTIGSIYRLKLDDLPTIHGTSPHDVSLFQAFEVGKKIIGRMPEVIIYAIEVGDIQTFGEECTEKVKESIPKVVKLIKNELT